MTEPRAPRWWPLVSSLCVLGAHQVAHQASSYSPQTNQELEPSVGACASPHPLVRRKTAGIAFNSSRNHHGWWMVIGNRGIIFTSFVVNLVNSKSCMACLCANVGVLDLNLPLLAIQAALTSHSLLLQKISDCRTSAIWDSFAERGPFFWHAPLLCVIVLVKPFALSLRSFCYLPRQPNTCESFVTQSHRDNNFFKCCVQCVTSTQAFW